MKYWILLVSCLWGTVSLQAMQENKTRVRAKKVIAIMIAGTFVVLPQVVEAPPVSVSLQNPGQLVYANDSQQSNALAVCSFVNDSISHEIVPVVRTMPNESPIKIVIKILGIAFAASTFVSICFPP